MELTFQIANCVIHHTTSTGQPLVPKPGKLVPMLYNLAGPRPVIVSISLFHQGEYVYPSTTQWLNVIAIVFRCIYHDLNQLKVNHD